MQVFHSWITQKIRIENRIHPVFRRTNQWLKIFFILPSHNSSLLLLELWVVSRRFKQIMAMVSRMTIVFAFIH